MTPPQQAEVGGAQEDGDLVLDGRAVERVMYPETGVTRFGTYNIGYRCGPAVVAEPGRVEPKPDDLLVVHQVYLDRLTVQISRMKQLYFERRFVVPHGGFGTVADGAVLLIIHAREHCRRNGLRGRV